MGVLIDIYREDQANSASDTFGFKTNSSFVKVGVLNVPFVKWTKRKADRKKSNPSNYEIYPSFSVGELLLTKSKVVGAKLTKDDRLKIENEMFAIVELLPSVGTYKVFIRNYKYTDAIAEYIE